MKSAEMCQKEKGNGGKGQSSVEQRLPHDTDVAFIVGFETQKVQSSRQFRYLGHQGRLT